MRIVGTPMKGKGAKAMRHTNKIMEIARELLEALSRGGVAAVVGLCFPLPTRANVSAQPNLRPAHVLSNHLINQIPHVMSAVDMGGALTFRPSTLTLYPPSHHRAIVFSRRSNPNPGPLAETPFLPYLRYDRPTRTGSFPSAPRICPKDL